MLLVVWDCVFVWTKFLGFFVFWVFCFCFCFCFADVTNYRKLSISK